MGKVKNSIKNIFYPKIDETTTYIISLIFILLYVTNKDLRDIFFTIHTNRGKTDFSSILFGIFIIIGLALSIFNAFVKREKTSSERYILLLYYIIINLFLAVFAFAYFGNEILKYEIIYFIINILYTYIVLVLFVKEELTEDDFINKDAGYLEIFLNSILVTGIFILYQYILEKSWIITFSICITYSITVNEIIKGYILKQFKRFSN